MNLEHITYDKESIEKSNRLKKAFIDCANLIETSLAKSREHSLALTNLENAFMWVGKAVRNDQILREEANEQE